MKKVIFLSMKFFNYEETISQSISKKGFQCQLMYSEPEYSFFDSLIKKVDKDWFLKKTEKYILSKLNDINECDYLIINFSPNLSDKSVELFRRKFPNIKIIYYIWDSVDNFPNVLNIANCCDKVYSFDRHDCKEYGYTFLPLFYSPINSHENKEKKYDYSMIFSIYPKKVSNYLLLKNALPDKKIAFKHIFVPKKMYYYYKSFFKEFKVLKKKDVKFYSLSRKKVYDIFESSKVTIDCPLTNQRGLTMRTFEALSLGIKIVTTNEDIINYDFYNENNIFVVKNKEDVVTEEFFDLPFDYSNSMEKYSIDNFVKRLTEELDND